MSEIQKNLVAKNDEYAAAFTKGHLPLPPGKKYLVLTCTLPIKPYFTFLTSPRHGCPN
jgi:hypothetical protein